MATNPSTLPENSGRITAPDANYPYGSAKDDSTGTTGDGTPIKKALLNDTYGFFQWLLTQAAIVPSGNAETVLASDLGDALNALFVAEADKADQATAEGGTDNADWMTSLRVFESFSQYGLGGNAGATSDFDALTKSGFYIITGATSGTYPPSVAAGTILHMERGSSGQRTQIFDALVGENADPIVYVRTARNSIWSPWLPMFGIGYEQSWQDVSGSRSAGVTYTNTTGKPIQVCITISSSASANSFDFLTNGVSIASASSSSIYTFTLNPIIKDGETYQLNLTGSMTIREWAELR